MKHVIVFVLVACMFTSSTRAQDPCASRSNVITLLCEVLQTDSIQDATARTEQLCGILRQLTYTQPPPDDADGRCALAAALYRMDRHVDAANVLTVAPSKCPKVFAESFWKSIKSAEPGKHSIQLSFPKSTLDTLYVVLTNNVNERRMMYCSRASGSSGSEQSFMRSEVDFDSRDLNLTVPQSGRWRLEAKWTDGSTTNDERVFTTNGTNQPALAYGKIQVFNIPASASITINNSDVHANVEPVKAMTDAGVYSTSVITGSYTVEVTAKEYLPMTYTGSVSVTTPLKIDAALKRLPTAAVTASPVPVSTPADKPEPAKVLSEPLPAIAAAPSPARTLTLGLRGAIAIHHRSGFAAGLGAVYSNTLGPEALHLQLRAGGLLASKTGLFGLGVGFQWLIHRHVALALAVEGFAAVMWDEKLGNAGAVHPVLELQIEPFANHFTILVGAGYYHFSHLAELDPGFFTLELGAGVRL